MVNKVIKITIVLLGSIISCFSNAQVEYKIMDNVSVNDNFEELLLPELQANIDSYKLQGFVKLERADNEFKLFYNGDYKIKREPEFFINLVKFHNDVAEYSSTSYVLGLPYEILRFLVEYTIYHKDAFLLDYLLGDNVSRGDGEYAEAFREEVTVPLLLRFPQIDNYLSDDDLKWHAQTIFDWLVINGGEEPEKYKDLQLILKKQSLKLSQAVENNLKVMILAKDGKLQYDELMDILNEQKNPEEILDPLINEYKLSDELKLYQ